MPACTSADSCFQASGRGCKPVSLGSCIPSNSAAMALTNIRKVSHCVFGCKPVGLQPIGILPELHYVIHVCPPGFVCRLHRYEQGAKPAQLDTAFQHMSQSEEQSDPQSHSQSDPQPQAGPQPQSRPHSAPQPQRSSATTELQSEQEVIIDVDENWAAQQAAVTGPEPQPPSVPQPQPLEDSEIGLDYPHCHLEAGIFKQFATGSECVCSSCNKACYPDQGTRPQHSRPVSGLNCFIVV